MKPAARITLATAASSLGGGIFYTLWLVIFLITADRLGATEASTIFPLAPLITALGFTLALLISHRFLKIEETPFLKVYLWPLSGCILGTAALYWYGPMLIVFSMLAVGTLSILLRETIMTCRKQKPR